MNENVICKYMGQDLGQYYIDRRDISMVLRNQGFTSLQVFWFLRYGTIKKKMRYIRAIHMFMIKRVSYEEKLWEWFNSNREIYEQNKKDFILQEE